MPTDKWEEFRAQQQKRRLEDEAKLAQRFRAYLDGDPKASMNEDPCERMRRASCDLMKALDDIATNWNGWAMAWADVADNMKERLKTRGCLDPSQPLAARDRPVSQGRRGPNR